MTPETTRRSGRRDAAIGAVLFAALVVLAVLQYRWIGQVSEVDRERLQQALGAAVARFSQDFNAEIEGAIQAVEGGRAPVQDEAALAGRLELWKSVAPHPELVANVSLVDVDEPALQRRGRGGPGRGGPFVIASNAGPVVIVPDRRGEPGDVRRAMAIELDGAFLRGTLLPELVVRDFGADYYVRVLGPRGVLYETEDAPTEMSAEAPLFLPRLGPARGKGGGPPKGKGFGGQKEFRQQQDWRVEAAYRSGAMGDVVAGLRMRNLAVSFGILLLMGVSIGMLMWSTRRANALARQQLEFVAGVTHELRTPLAVILSASQNLADGVASGAAQTQRYGGVIHAQTKRLSGMVEQVLRFAGVSSQYGEIQRAPVAIARVVTEAVADSEPELNAAGCTLKQDVAEGLPEVQGDRAALLHCVRNLLSNAAKHAPGTAVTLSVRQDGAGMLEIAVEDDGPGFGSGDLARVLEPFYRGKRAKDEQVQGSGLGLSLVKKIAEAHSGRAEASNRAGGGAVVRMLLPLRGA